MAISAKDVQKLREMTGVGMMDCKKALTEANGDFDKAIEWLREKGLAAQTKKAGKIAAEGVSYAITADNGVGVVIEVNSQTDFVAKNEVFQGFVKDLATIVANENPADVEALKACTYPGTDRTVADVTADKVLAIGENIQVRRFVRYAEGVNVPYIHMGGKIGVLVNLEVEGIEAGKVTELGKDIAMQIAAMNPAYLDKSDVDQATLDKEKEILLIQAKEDPKNANKPENIIEKMVMGRIGKYYEENCLLQQAFVKENKVSVEKHIAEVAKQLGGKIAVKAFTRLRRRSGQHDPLILFPEYELIKMRPRQHSCFGLIFYKNPPGAAHREDHNAGNQLRAMAAASMAIISSSLVGMLPSGPRPAGDPHSFLCSGEINSPCANCRATAILWSSPPTKKVLPARCAGRTAALGIRRGQSPRCPWRSSAPRWWG